MSENYTPRLKTRYREEIKDALNKEFSYDNVMQIPGVVKVVVNMGVGDAARDAKVINGALEDLTAITGQKPQLRRAKKSIANFKLREGMPIGARVTLRGDRMWEFMDRLLTIALPRIRDFPVCLTSSSTATVTTLSVCLSKPCSTKSTWTRLTVHAVWTSPLLPPLPTMRKAASCFASSVSHSSKARV